jgi:hypothetical protein
VHDHEHEHESQRAKEYVVHTQEDTVGNKEELEGRAETGGGVESESESGDEEADAQTESDALDVGNEISAATEPLEQEQSKSIQQQQQQQQNNRQQQQEEEEERPQQPLSTSQMVLQRQKTQEREPSEQETGLKSQQDAQSQEEKDRERLHLQEQLRDLRIRFGALQTDHIQQHQAVQVLRQV